MKYCRRNSDEKIVVIGAVRINLLIIIHISIIFWFLFGKIVILIAQTINNIKTQLKLKQSTDRNKK